MNISPVARALISVSDKTNIVEFAQSLTEMNIEIISTGGTSQVLTKAFVPHRQIEALTELTPMLDGRVKTLHPKIHGAILGKRDVHQDEMKLHQLQCIDLVVVNFYPFATILKDEKSWDELVEYIDIGGPTLVRAAAKNFAWVGVIVDQQDYAATIAELKTYNGLTETKRQHLAAKAFSYTAQYDAMINQYFAAKLNLQDETNKFPEQLFLTLDKKTILRYGENPHQAAAAYQFNAANLAHLSFNQSNTLLHAIQHQGKPLSYNNLLDAEAAINAIKELTSPACVIIKHAQPCGIALGVDVNEAYLRAYQADAKSAFGGIVAFNQTCTAEIAQAITSIFMEVIIAPGYTKEALAIFNTKPNLRVLSLDLAPVNQFEMRFIDGGMLMQDKDLASINPHDLQVVTQVNPTVSQMEALFFAWSIVKHVKSNAIVIANQYATIGIGGGQVSRVDAVEMAILKAGDYLKNESEKTLVLASDAFFPFADSIDRIGKTNIKAIIQPGGSVNDEKVIAACNAHGMAMVFTHQRCFKH